MQRRKKVTSVDKANVLTEIYGLWREVFTGIAKGYRRSPQSSTSSMRHHVVREEPEWFDVVVTPNMFGDIITTWGP